MKTFKEYEDFALSTIVYPNAGENLVYPALGLVGESGEFADKVKKRWRNHGTMCAKTMSVQERLDGVKELGDVLWYIAASAREIGYTLEEVASINEEKLRDRRVRGVIKSEGDSR